MDTPIGTLILVYHNPYKTMVVFHPLDTLNNQGTFFHCSYGRLITNFDFPNYVQSVQCGAFAIDVTLQSLHGLLGWINIWNITAIMVGMIRQESINIHHNPTGFMGLEDLTTTTSSADAHIIQSLKLPIRLPHFMGKCHRRRKICPLAHLFITQPKIEWKEQQINFELWKKRLSHLTILVA